MRRTSKKRATAGSAKLPPTLVRRMKRLRPQRKFHPLAQSRLIKLCRQWHPELHPIKEIQGLAGGRNDLLMFEFDGRKVLIEIFGTASQVSRDLRIMDQTKADIKIAIIIDKEVDPPCSRHSFERTLRAITHSFQHRNSSTMSDYTRGG